MSCMLRYSGESLDVEKLLAAIPLAPNRSWLRGSRDFRQRICPTSGASFVASDAEMDQFDAQIAECIAFLGNHQAALAAAASLPGVDHAVLDFGVELRDVAVHVDLFPAPLVAAAASCGLALAISHYPQCVPESES
jgi:hypothetical protein